MLTHYEPVTDNAQWLARFGMALPESAPPATAGPAAAWPVILHADTAPEGALGDVRLGQLGLLPPVAGTADLAQHTMHCPVEAMKSQAKVRESWWAGRRCIVPVAHVSAWSYATGRPQRWQVQHADGAPLALAGLWNEWTGPAGEAMLCFSVLTRAADEHAVFRHLTLPGQPPRMPVMLAAPALPLWLDGGLKDAERLLQRAATEPLNAAPEARATALPREPASWSVLPDMFAHEWHAMAVEAPPPRTPRGPRALRIPASEPVGPTTAELF
jgi:putative SOS response-associated peptidase YedK